MNTDAKGSFLHSIKKITDPVIKMAVDDAITSVEDAKSIKEIPNLKKLKGNKKGIFYRIKTGYYRIGVTIENDTVIFVICLPRKDIYKVFP